MTFDVRTPDHIVVEIRQAISDGLTQQDIIRKFGLHRMTLYRMAERGEIDAVPSHGRRGPEKGAHAVGSFPKWIDREYRSTYWDNRKLYGEHGAARIARADMAEARRAEI